MWGDTLDFFPDPLRFSRDFLGNFLGSTELLKLEFEIAQLCSLSQLAVTFFNQRFSLSSLILTDRLLSRNDKDGKFYSLFYHSPEVYNAVLIVVTFIWNSLKEKTQTHFCVFIISILVWIGIMFNMPSVIKLQILLQFFSLLIISFTLYFFLLEGGQIWVKIYDYLDQEIKHNFKEAPTHRPNSWHQGGEYYILAHLHHL